MANIFLISDTHFGHENTFAKFKQADGTPMRPFQSVQEMDDYMVDKWNSVVKLQDKVYHLGDVAMAKSSISVIGRCNGHKRLVRGNHDDYAMKIYALYFEEIYGSRLLDRLLLTHIPVHPESIGKAIANVHGHVHNNVSALHFGPRYFNVSVEVIDYTPVSLEDLKLRIAKQQESYSHSLSICV
jgi:calcineurin-like phosphoesterase family protein